MKHCLFFRDSKYVIVPAIMLLLCCGTSEGHRKDPDDPSVYTHTDKKRGFSIMYPTWWKTQTNAMGLAFLAYDENGASIRVQHMQPPDKTSALLTIDEMSFDDAKLCGESWAKTYLATMRKATDIHQNIKVTGQGLVRFHDTGFYLLVYTWNVAGGTKEMTHKVWMHIKQGKFYLLTISYPTHSESIEKLTNLLAATYRILK